MRFYADFKKSICPIIEEKNYNEKHYIYNVDNTKTLKAILVFKDKFGRSRKNSKDSNKIIYNCNCPNEKYHTTTSKPTDFFYCS